jgi:hypothetical protein
LGHINPISLWELLPAEIKFNPTIDKLICDVCYVTKKNAKIIYIPQTRATTPFELVPSDLSGPFKPSLEGTHYYLIYIDYFTHYIHIYFLATVISVKIISKFKYYNAWVKNQGHCLEDFRYDNSIREYANKVFWSILAQDGISFEPSPPYIQYKNSISG